MFGCHAVYAGAKLFLILRNKKDHTDANGVWVATKKEHHASLKKILPSLQSVYLLSDGKSETNWQMIPADSDSFEEEAISVCELILEGDPRVGTIPKSKSKVKIQKSKGGK